MRGPARWGRRTIATVTAVALAVGVALVASATGPDPGPPAAAGSNDPAAACRDLRAGAMVACLHGNDAPCTSARPSRSWRPTAACAAPAPGCAAWPASSRRPARRAPVPNRSRCAASATAPPQPDPGHLRPRVGRDRPVPERGPVAAASGWPRPTRRSGPAPARPAAAAPALRHRPRLPAGRRQGDAHPGGDNSFSLMRAELVARASTAATASTWSGRRRGRDPRPGRGLRRHSAPARRTATTAARCTPGWTRPAGSTPSCTRSSTTWARSSRRAPPPAPPGTAPTRPTSCATTTTAPARW